MNIHDLKGHKLNRSVIASMLGGVTVSSARKKIEGEGLVITEEGNLWCIDQPEPKSNPKPKPKTRKKKGEAADAD